MPIRKILVPVDFSPESLRALQHGSDLADKFGASLHVLHVWEMPTYLRPDLTVWSGELSATVEDHAHAEAEKAMKTFLADAKVEGRAGLTAQVMSGVPEVAILGIAEDGSYDMIVMGTHGRTGFSHLLLGSVAERVVRRATCPVLTVRAP